MINNKIFDVCFENLIEKEGGYSDDPQDSGGKTKYGISQSSYPNLNILTLTLEDAKNIYFKDFWVAYKCEQIKNEDLVSLYFNSCVNMGGRQAVKILQKALNYFSLKVNVDGIMGQQTIAAISNLSISETTYFISFYKLELSKYYLSLVNEKSSNIKFLKGWLNRILN